MELYEEMIIALFKKEIGLSQYQNCLEKIICCLEEMGSSGGRHDFGSFF